MATKLLVSDRAWIDGRGQVLVVKQSEHNDLDLMSLKDELVEADGKAWRVVGIESFEIGTFRADRVGLLVRPV